MHNIITEWLLANKIELLGAILGISYIFFSIRQHIFTWPTGLITSARYVYIFFQAKLYADMGLQVYYVLISIYGWYFWLKGKRPASSKKVLVKKNKENTLDEASGHFIGIVSNNSLCPIELHRFRRSLYGFHIHRIEYCGNMDACP